MARTTFVMKKNRPRWTYLPAYFALHGLFGFFRLLPMDLASTLGGRLGQRVGPFLKWHRIATRNLHFIYPDWEDSRYQATLSAMWENLGRNLAEYFWLNTAQLHARIEIDETSRRLLAEAPHQGKPVICFGGHIANWEIVPLSIHLQGLQLALIYRRANNPYVEKLIHRIRQDYSVAHFPKGPKGAAEAIRALKQGNSVGMLVDQKMNNGISFPFLGKPAMTATAIAELATKYGARIIGVRIQRLQGVRFRVTAQEVFLPEDSPSQAEAVNTIMLKIHSLLEEWINDDPAQWLWVHQRWQKWKD